MSMWYGLTTKRRNEKMIMGEWLWFYYLIPIMGGYRFVTSCNNGAGDLKTDILSRNVGKINSEKKTKKLKDHKLWVIVSLQI